MTSKGERLALPARVGWVIGPSGEAGSLVRRDGERTACFASFHGRAWYLYADPYTSSVVLCGCAADEDDVRAAAEAALWARDGFGVGEVYGARVEAWEMGHGDPGLLPGLPGRWTVTAVRPAEGGVEVDAVSAPDTQVEADAARAHVTGAADADRSHAEPASWNWCWPCNQAVDIDDDTHEGSRVRCLGCRAWHVVCRDGDGAWSLESEAEHDAEGEADDARGTAKDASPLTHALDAEGNALCPYDPATLAYVSPRADRVTCPVCAEKAQATAEPAPREPSAPNDADELARLLPGLAHDLDMVTELRFESQRSTPIQRVALACKLLLGERAPLAAERDRWKALAHKACADACDTDAKIATLRASRAKEAQVATRDVAWTCTTCGISGTTEMLADDGAGPVCPECRQARHLCMHAPAGYRVAALLAELKRMREEGDGDMREAIEAAREHLGAPTPLDRAVGEAMVRAKGFADQRYPGAWIDLARETADAQDGNHRENAIECAGLCLRAALACDASATKEPG